jgi:hypothetical protein
MLCCLLAALLALVGVKGHRQQIGSSARELRYTRHPVSRTGFGVCCGIIAFEVAAAVAGAAGGLRTTHPAVIVLLATAVTLAGVLFARAHGTPTCRRAWALWGLGASAGSGLTELLDLHVLALHAGPDLAASVVLHGLALVLGVMAGRLLLLVGAREEARTWGAPAATIPPR